MHPNFNGPAAFRQYALAAILTAILVSPGRANPLVADSPFIPAGSTALAGSAGSAEAYELAGSSAQGTQVSVCIFERQKKHSYWIPVGGESDGIHVISYDRAMDSAVVTILGTRKQLTMRTSTVASSEPTPNRVAGVQYPTPPAPIAAAPVQPEQPMTTAAQQQREARMLVSDLLEIGVQQRKAYQEARQRAASGAQASPEN